MKKRFEVFPLVLLLLFIFSWTPFQAFHGHEAEWHAFAAHLSHSEKEHCDLDDYFCENGLAQDCDHQQHLGKPLEKCLSCQFHFLKHYVAQENLPEAYLTSQHVNYACQQVQAASRFTLLASNRGPPQRV